MTMMQNMPPQGMAQMMEHVMAQGGGGMPGGGMPGGGHGHGGNVVTLTQEESAAVDRLCELGFPKSACVEAYLLCDKNEQLAANYLFNNPPDDR
jgi:UV excision repair protein RAD23